ncbi:MAG: twin-arginine translocase subunit TatC [Thermoanaerobaculia bacterium]|nr:MAG: twin-arginine translocase subunit TatC [Thermoanaerobaculia bacterium]MBZ0101181.1 twin-arginine translocase subunit TatC [Thermoanaerobaculia bacterium]
MSPGPQPRRGDAAPERPEELSRMTLLEHLEELRKRLIRIVLALAAGVAACFSWAPEICRFLAAPIYDYLPAGKRLAVLGVTDTFVLYFKTALLAGTFLAFPLILWQVWQFVAPGLYARERRWIGPFVALGWLFFLGGGAFAYYVAFPFTVEFLLGMAGDFEPVITAERYYGFLLTIVLGLGLMFELPIFLTLAARLGLVSAGFLLRHFRWAVLIICVAAALLTPTADIVNLGLFAIPTIGLYLLGVAGAALLGKKRVTADAD